VSVINEVSPAEEVNLIKSEFDIPNYLEKEWINSSPISIGNTLNEDKVVLIDFWTYTCVNCIRTFPFLVEWNEKYKDKGLVIIGVHTPEFEFEKEIANIKNSVEKNNLSYPIVLDNDFEIWDEFKNRYWPAKYLFNSRGEVVYTHFGEGGYVEAENEIRKVLQESGKNVDEINVGMIENQELDENAVGGFFAENSGIDSNNSSGEKPYYRMTRELYMGHGRNFSYGGMYAGNMDYYDERDRVHQYSHNGEYDHNKFYLSGSWLNGEESLTWKSSQQSDKDYLSFKFRSKSVNGVFSSNNGSKVFIKIDGEYLSKNQAGIDIQFDSDGRSYLYIQEPKMYSVVILDKYNEQIISLYPEDEFASFAFTFGSYSEGF
jgi:thiol-disulfide isomerase/thioredoxin